MTMTIIKTGCWFSPLPPDHLRVGISRGTPRGLSPGYRRYTKLNPGPWFNSVSESEYIARYSAEVLDRLDPARTRDELLALAGGRVPVLCCYERVGGPQWCHRSLVSEWFATTIGLIVPEFGHEAVQVHPLAPPTPRGS